MAATYTAGDVMDTAAALMNDAAKSLFTYDVQLPYLKMAFQELDQQLNLNECPLNLIDEYETVLLANTVNPSLPTSFFLPIRLYERTNGSTLETDYVKMTEVASVNSLNLTPTTTLGYWDWRHNCINTITATVSRQIKMVYWRILSVPDDSGDIILQASAQNFLANKVAEKLARYIRKQTDVANSLQLDAEKSLDLMLSVLVKNHQGLRVRRKKFRNVRNSNFLYW